MGIFQNIQQTWSLIIIAPKSRWLDGLRTLLQTIPQVKQVKQTDNLRQGTTLVNEQPPNAIFVDADLPRDAAWQFAAQIKAKHPEVSCILLVNDQKQKELAGHLGADAVLLKGFTQQTLQQTLTTLLSRPSAT